MPCSLFSSHLTSAPSPPLYGALLEILNGFASASRQQLNASLQHHEEGSPAREGITKLVLAQDCALAQLVIEVCASGNAEIRSISCGFLHQLWIAQPSTLHLLHHQGYPADAVPVLVEHVPSMHVCIDFLPALLGKRARFLFFWLTLPQTLLTHRRAACGPCTWPRTC